MAAFPASKSDSKGKTKGKLPWKPKGKGPDAISQEVTPKGKKKPMKKASKKK